MPHFFTTVNCLHIFYHASLLYKWLRIVTRIQNKIPRNISLKASAGIWLSIEVMSCSSRSLDAWFASSVGSRDAIANTSSDTTSTASVAIKISLATTYQNQKIFENFVMYVQFLSLYRMRLCGNIMARPWTKHSLVTIK